MKKQFSYQIKTDKCVSTGTMYAYKVKEVLHKCNEFITLRGLENLNPAVKIHSL